MTSDEIGGGIPPKDRPGAGDPRIDRAEAVRVETARTDATPDARPLTTLFSDLANETSALVRQEVALARTELSEKVGQIGTGVASLAIGGAVAFAGLLFLLLAATYALAEIMDAWLAALIVGVVVAVIGAVLLMSGRRKLSATNLQPRRTIETLKEDGRWAKAQVGR